MLRSEHKTMSVASEIWQPSVAKLGSSATPAIWPSLTVKLEDRIICSPAVSKLGLVSAAEFMALGLFHCQSA